MAFRMRFNGIDTLPFLLPTLDVGVCILAKARDGSKIAVSGVDVGMSRRSVGNVNLVQSADVKSSTTCRAFPDGAGTEGLEINARGADVIVEGR